MNTVINIIKKPFFTALLAFEMLLVLTQLAAYQHYLLYQTNRLKEETNAANRSKEKLEMVLANSLSATQTLSFIIKKYGIKNDFDSVARQLLASSRGIDAIELAEGGQVTHAYPLTGNEAVIGYNIFNDSLQSIEAFKAIARGGLFFAGPLQLKQGGTGIVGRLPVFIDDRFWGFAISIVRLPTLIKAAGLDADSGDYVYQLSKLNPTTHREEFFLPDAGFSKNTNVAFVDVPTGDWKIYVAQKHSSALASVLPFSLLGLLLSLMGGAFAFMLSRQPVRLKKMVEEKSSLLIASEENYRETVDRISDAVISLDSEWRYTFLNGPALTTHPRGREHVMGKSIWHIHPEMVGTVFWDKYHEAMRTQKIVEIEDYYAPMDTWFSVRVYPSPGGLTIFYRDITETKKIEQEIISERNLSEFAINSLPGVFYMYDSTGRFIRWNRNFEIVSGYTSEEIKTMHPLDFFDADEKELLAQRIAKVFETGWAEVEANLFTKGRQKIEYYFNGHAVKVDGTDYLLGMGIDITERKKAERALKESEEKYRYLFNNNPAAIIIWDTETFRLLEVNNIAVEQYGYTRDEFLNMTMLDYRPEEDRGAVMEWARAKIKSSDTKTRGTRRHIRKNGTLMYMDVTSHRIDYDGRKAVLSLAKDITEQVIIEKQLEETYEDIRRLNTHLQTVREEERAGIAREIHDELGQRLTVLKMDAAWLLRKIAGEAEAEREKLAGMIALIDDTVKTIRRISSDIRPGVLDDLGLIAALEWQSSEFERQTGIPIQFTSLLTEEPVEKNLASGIFRVYQETLTNVMRHAQATLVETLLNLSGDDIVLTIKDNGRGFDPAEAKSKKTLGILGMKERALMFSGELTIKSQNGHGTTIVLKVPLVSYPHKTTA